MTNAPNNMPPQVIICETDDRSARVSVRLDGETVWLTQQQVSDLYGTSRPNVTMHIKKFPPDGELNEDTVCKKCLQTVADGRGTKVAHKTTPVKAWSVYVPGDRTFAAKTADSAADISALEAEIDRRVCELYGLTAPETAIVKGTLL